ncbi:MAG: calcium-binding protein, partial [Acidimicrobiia bacterium]
MRRTPLLAVALMALAVMPAAAAPGDLDTSFGVGGVLTTNFGGTYDWAYAVAVQPDARIVAAGVSNAGKTYDFALARYT